MGLRQDFGVLHFEKSINYIQKKWGKNEEELW